MRRIFTHVAWCNLVPRGRVKTYFIVAATVNEFPYILFPPIGGKESIRRRLSMVYLIDNKVLGKAFVISLCVRFTNFMPVRIIFNRIFSFFFFSSFLQRTNHADIFFFLANESGRETITTTTTHASIFSRGNPQKNPKDAISVLCIRWWNDLARINVNEHDN